MDPETIGYEAFVRDGKVYSYFGIFPSLLRGLFAPFVDLEHTYISRVSCFAATLVIAVFLVKMFRVAQYQTSAIYKSYPGPAVKNSYRFNVTYTMPVG